MVRSRPGVWPWEASACFFCLKLLLAAVRAGGDAVVFLSVAVFATSMDFEWPKTERRVLFDPNAMSGASCNSLGAGVQVREPYVLLVQMRFRRVSKGGKVVIPWVRVRFLSILRCSRSENHTFCWSKCDLHRLWGGFWVAIGRAPMRKGFCRTRRNFA